MANTKLQRLKAERAELIALLKEIQSSSETDLKAEEKLLDWLDANQIAILKTRPAVPDLPTLGCGDDFHRSDDWVNIY